MGFELYALLIADSSLLIADIYFANSSTLTTPTGFFSDASLAWLTI
jgi:hypothetical protein